MTQQEKDMELKAAKEQRENLDRYAVEQYHKTIQMAAERLAAAREYNKLVQQRTIAEIDKYEVDRNHERCTKECAHDFMRYIKKAIFAFKADKREFVYDQNGQIDAITDQHFTIMPDKVVYTITVVMRRFEYENKTC